MPESGNRILSTPPTVSASAKHCLVASSDRCVRRRRQSVAASPSVQLIAASGRAASAVVVPTHVVQDVELHGGEPLLEELPRLIPQGSVVWAGAGRPASSAPTGPPPSIPSRSAFPRARREHRALLSDVAVPQRRVYLNCFQLSGTGAAIPKFCCRSPVTVTTSCARPLLSAAAGCATPSRSTRARPLDD